MQSKKIVTVVVCCLAGVIAAAGAVFLIISLIKNNTAETFSSGNFSSFDNSIVDTEAGPPAADEGLLPTDNGVQLQITSPVQKNSNTNESIYTFFGSSDPLEPLTLNGNSVERLTDGSFAVTVELPIGKSSYTFLHKGKSYVYTVNRKYIVINSFSPNGNQIYSSGSTFGVVVNARPNSFVTASFNGETINLVQKQTSGPIGEFCDYIGSFKLPTDNYADLNLGKVTFSASQNGVTDTVYSGNITCKRPDFIVDYDPNATPLGDRYVNVGSGKITEIIGYEAETFNAKSTDDLSRPTNSYLPMGTVDYSSDTYYYYGQKEYVLLRCGKQVYTNSKDVPTNEIRPVVKHYAGTLPDHNEIGIASFENGNRHTVLTLDTIWKAPFYFDILPQAYNNPNRQDYTISSFTASYIDITFCYATVFEGELEIPEDNPLFSSAKIIKNQSDYTLRLYLKKQGGFYGWDASYNKEGQLVFEFLNPAKVTAANNIYGANLSGVEILLDVGHGGKDCGALSFNDNKGNPLNSEAKRNLVLAELLKKELEAMGATVHMTRTSDITSSNHDKIQLAKKLKPDLIIAIHHNANNSSSPNGFDSYYFHPFSEKAAEFIYMNTANTNIYKSSSLGWHYYYMARSSYCPVVLTENGYITNSQDFQNIISESVNIAKAQAIAKGVAEYFLSIQ